MPASGHHVVGEETYSASLATDGAAVATPSLDCPFSSQTEVKAQGSPVPSTFESVQLRNNVPNETAKLCGSTDSSAASSSHKELSPHTHPQVPSFFGQTAADTLGVSQQTQGEARKASREQAEGQGRGQPPAALYRYLRRPVSRSGSASLPRGYRRSEGSSRLSAAITARPFGTKQARVSSLPRLRNVSPLVRLLHTQHNTLSILIKLL